MQHRQRLFTPSEKKEGDPEATLTQKQQLDHERGQELLRLAKEQSPMPQQWPMVVSLLLNAIDLKHQESADFLIKRIITNHKMNINTDLKHIIEELKKIYTTNSVAAYVLGELYCGILQPPKNQLLPILPDEKISIEERQEKAIQYLENALVQGNEQARISLFTTLTKSKGCITANGKRWGEINKKLANSGNQTSAFDYATYTLSPTYSGKKDEEYIEYLFIATRGKNQDIAYKALEKVCEYFKNDPRRLEKESNSLLELLQNESTVGNQLISYCLAYSYCPPDKLPNINIQPSKLFSELITGLEPSLDNCESYLAKSMNGMNTEVNKAAALFKEKLNPDDRIKNTNK
jgi:hypothetical protein